MRHYPLQQPTPTRALIRVRNVRQTVRAGTDATKVCVRTLDGVSAMVSAGELVILRGGVASGAPSLAAFMAGYRHGMHGTREIASGVRVRRGSISYSAFCALRTAWETAIPRDKCVTTDDLETAQKYATPVVYVFRVREDLALRPSPRSSVRADGGYDAWREWAQVVRVHGGSVVVQCATRQRKHREQPSSAVHERPPHDRQRTSSARVRVLTLAEGRVVTRA